MKDRWASSIYKHEKVFDLEFISFSLSGIQPHVFQFAGISFLDSVLLDYFNLSFD